MATMFDPLTGNPFAYMQNLPTAEAWLQSSGLFGMPQDEARTYLLNQFGGATREDLLRALYGRTGNEPPESDIDVFNPGTLQLTPNFDPTYEGGQYGAYVPVFGADGTLQDVQFQKRERSGGWLADNLDIVGPALVLGFAALGAGGFLPGGASSPLATQAAPITESLISNLGMNPDLATSLQYLTQNGLSMAEAQSIMGQAATEILTGTMGPVAGGSLPTWVTQAAQTLIPNGANLLQNVPGMSQTNTPLQTPPAKEPGMWDKLGKPLGVSGDTLKGVIGGGLGMFNAEKQADKIAQLGQGALQQGIDVRDWVMNQSKPFTPYNITTGTGSTKTNADGSVSAQLNPALRGTIDTATGVANKMFGAAKDFDYEQNALEEYGLMRSILEGDREREALGLESRMARQGRLGVASFADANSIVGPNGEVYGTSPELIAWQKGVRDQDLKTLLAARQTGLDRQGMMIGQGNQALQPAQTGANMEQGLLGTAGNFGASRSSTQNATVNNAIQPWMSGYNSYLSAKGNAMGVDNNATNTFLRSLFS